MTAPVAEIDAGTSRTAYIGIGSNLDRPAARVRRAADALSRLPGTRLRAVSPLYRNPAVGPGEQPDYVNAVAVIETTLEAHALLDRLQAIERRHGRERGSMRWQPRTIDLDVLLYGDRVIDDERLTVPHPRIGERPFVLKPLHDVEPALVIPGVGRVEGLLAGVSQESLCRIGDHEGCC